MISLSISQLLSPNILISTLAQGAYMVLGRMTKKP
jgi:hypothetical protein